MKYCEDPDNCEYADCPTAFCDRDGSPREIISTLEIALAESLKLQAHYAQLLNMHDGGERMIFISVESWIKRLKEIKMIPSKP
jgi:hypothetical protein